MLHYGTNRGPWRIPDRMYLSGNPRILVNQDDMVFSGQTKNISWIPAVYGMKKNSKMTLSEYQDRLSPHSEIQKLKLKENSIYHKMINFNF